MPTNMVAQLGIHNLGLGIRVQNRASRQDPVTLARPPIGRNFFSETLLEASSSRNPSRGLRVVFSISLHILVLLALLLPPLYYTDTLNLRQFTQTFLVAPPPPPPPPPQGVVKTSAPLRRVLLTGGKLFTPTVVPSKVAMLKEEPLAPEMGGGVVGGVPGGVPGGQLGGVIGGIISDSPSASRPIPLATATAKPRAPIRIGGRVRAPRLLSQSAPIYPVLAKQTHLTGTVSIDAVIDTQGNVVEMTVVSGPVLLIPAALDAVKQWKYEPTYLDDQPVAVQLVAHVVFQLNY